MNDDQKKSYVSIWEDHVEIKDLIIALVFCVIPAMAGYIFAPPNPPLPLAFGLTGAFIGFIIACIIIKPKRALHTSDEE